jgi:hypothetical protein
MGCLIEPHAQTEKLSHRPPLGHTTCYIHTLYSSQRRQHKNFLAAEPLFALLFWSENLREQRAAQGVPQTMRRHNGRALRRLPHENHVDAKISTRKKPTSFIHSLVWVHGRCIFYASRDLVWDALPMLPFTSVNLRKRSATTKLTFYLWDKYHYIPLNYICQKN